MPFTQLSTENSSPRLSLAAHRNKHAGTQSQCWNRSRNSWFAKARPFTSGSTRGGCSLSAVLGNTEVRGPSRTQPGKGFEVKGNALEARLTHSKTIGADRSLSYRLVLVSEHCYVRKQNWLSSGWQVISQKADFPRDYPLWMPSGNLKGCLQRELRYDTAYALQRRVMDVLASDGQKLFTHGVGHFWSPHSGRNFLPSAAGAINVDKCDRDMLGGWAAQESDRYNRVARLRIRTVQERVAETFADRANHDPLFESDAIEEFRMFLQGQGTSAESAG